MRVLRGIGRWLWRFMIIFSFIVNIVLVVVLVVLGAYIFEIKNNVAQPLIGGLYSTAEGLHDATIDWTIPVRDNIPVNLDIPLQTDTIVRLTAAVPIKVNATIDLPGINAYGVSAAVNLELPIGLELPVSLDLNVPVRERLDVSLDVRAVIPLAKTQLADPVNNLGLLFEPLAIGLHNLPENFDEAGQMVGMVLRGEEINLLATDGSGGINSQPFVAWPGYSQTAGLNYTLLNQPVPLQNLPIQTGIVPTGGIPFLDELLWDRSSYYQGDDTPASHNQQAISNMEGKGISSTAYNGLVQQLYRVMDAVDIIGDGTQTIAPLDPLPATPLPTQEFGIIESTVTPGQ